MVLFVIGVILFALFLFNTVTMIVSLRMIEGDGRPVTPQRADPRRTTASGARMRLSETGSESLRPSIVAPRSY